MQGERGYTLSILALVVTVLESGGALKGGSVHRLPCIDRSTHSQTAIRTSSVQDRPLELHAVSSNRLRPFRNQEGIYIYDTGGLGQKSPLADEGNSSHMHAATISSHKLYLPAFREAAACESASRDGDIATKINFFLNCCNLGYK